MKKVLVLIGILALAFTLIACGNNGVNNAVNTSEDNVASTEETSDATEAEATKVETSTSDEEELAVGKKVPNYELTTLEGETVSLHDYDGQIILLNFWATW